MKKFLGILFSAFLVLAVTGCKLTLEGETTTISWMAKEVKAYLFDSTDDIRDSIKYMIDEGTGQIPLNKTYEEKFDELLAEGFVFDEEKFNDEPSYYYPDFSDIPCDYVVIPYHKSHDVSNNGYVRQYYNTFAMWIYKYDRVNEICSEVMILDTSYKL